MLYIIHPVLVFTKLNLWCDLKQTAKHTGSKIPLIIKFQKYKYIFFHETITDPFYNIDLLQYLEEEDNKQSSNII